MSPELMRLRAHEKALVAFVNGPAHAGFVEARKLELGMVKQAILDLDPTERKDEIEQYKLRGEMRVLENLVDSFPWALEELRNRISDLEDEEASRRDRQTHADTDRDTSEVVT
jgi:hypothetical protein